MSDFEKIKNAMQLVANHKLPSRELREKDFDILAETAIKAIWLIQKENEKHRSTEDSYFPW